MLKRSFIWAVVAVFAFSCDQFEFGEQYDEMGNLTRDRERIENYLATNPYEYVEKIEDESGTVILIQEESTLNKPSTGSVIYTNYTGRLLDGTIFETTLENVAREHGLFDEEKVYEPDFFVLNSNQRIAGFSYGFRNLRSGSKAVLIIPSPHAYRDRDQGPIPANSVLVFEVDFLGMD
ncbi:FKBP-type peptidyl-prolyl cis-trans isomerase [Litoribacter ruber]|uniref:Peptidyl-prolyl cis-trans isomerase n=2 Tax=Litoribacter ruber TaxID=702568 RepID=A0AAP2CJI2_9BACT|nr:FKBP-type peptidyl-prolyl cis-trans isomerase [Litoribacter alkaliphilus]MBT0809849.1 FKBP-type peptidyl-prolyl cis-trans isomerase [Litoribacter ruber]